MNFNMLMLYQRILQRIGLDNYDNIRIDTEIIKFTDFNNVSSNVFSAYIDVLCSCHIYRISLELIDFLNLNIEISK